MIVDTNYLVPAELQALQPAENISFWNWLDKYYQLDNQSSAVSGKYPRELVPYFKIVADWLDDNKVKQVIWRKAAQEGVTTFALAWLLRRQHQSPAPQILTMADEETVQRLNETRLQPALKSATCFDGVTFNLKQQEIRLSNGGSILMAWASSIARTASSSIRDTVIDEITKPGYSLQTTEGDSIDRILQRSITYPNRKALIMSTVTAEGDKMHQLEQQSDCVYYVHIPSPCCGVFQPLHFFPGGVYVDQHRQEQPAGYVCWDNDQPTTEKKARTALYKCGACGETFTNAEKNQALAHCIAVPNKEPDADSDTRFFSTWRILSPRDAGSLAAIVRGFLDAKDDPSKLQSYVNNVLAQYWTDRVAKPDDKLFESYRLDYAAGTVPADAVCLIASVDVQKRGFYFVIRAWTAEETSYKVEHGYLSTEEELNDLIFAKTWKLQDGQHMGVWRAGIDTGGAEKSTEAGNVSSTEWVYRWYLKNRARGVRIILTKGSSKPLPTLVKIGAPMMSLPNGKPIKNGLQVISIDTNKTKDLFFWRVAETAKPEPVCPCYTSKEEQLDYIKQLKSEEKRRDRKTNSTRWVQISADNHYLDCEQMQQALASRELYGGVVIIKKAITCGATRGSQPGQPPKKRRPQPSSSGNAGNPFGDGGNFWSNNNA